MSLIRTTIPFWLSVQAFIFGTFAMPACIAMHYRFHALIYVPTYLSLPPGCLPYRDRPQALLALLIRRRQ